MLTKAQAVPFADYKAIEAVNWSTLKAMRDSPLHYLDALKHPREDADPLRLGRAVHTAVLEPDRFPLEYVVWEGGARRGKEWKAFKAANAKRTILTREQYQLTLGMRDSIHGNRLCMEFLDAGVAEHVISWTDEETGILCKLRADFINLGRGAIVDLKSTASIAGFMFGRQVARLGHHGQIAMYRRGYKAATGDLLAPVFLAVEQKRPHDSTAFIVPDDVLAVGDAMVTECLRQVAECRATDKWPGRYTEPQVLNLPRWVFDDGDGVDGLELVTDGSEED